MNASNPQRKLRRLIVVKNHSTILLSPTSLCPGWLFLCELRIVFLPGAIFRKRSDPLPVGFVLVHPVVGHYVFRGRVALTETRSHRTPPRVAQSVAHRTGER